MNNKDELRIKQQPIILNKKSAFMSLYLAEKEFFLPDGLRKALSLISYLIKIKKKPKNVAIYQANEKYKKKYDIDYTVSFLREKYNTRLAYLKNAEDKFELWQQEITKRHYGELPKLCKCGCGQEVKKGNTYINGHNAKCRSKEENEKLAENMRKTKEITKNNNIIFLKDRKP